MPCVMVHMLVAREVAEAWKQTPSEAPVDLRTRSALHAFYHGALAPDMGFAPGSDRFVSDLAHHLATGDLARALLARSRDEVERAFAYGWLTHVVSDAELHPLVGRAMGERVLGDRDVRMNTHDDLEAHVSIEVGLDAVLQERVPSVPNPPYRALEPRRLQPLSDALEETFGLRWPVPELHATHLRTARLFALWPLGLRLLSRGMSGDGERAGAVARGVRRGLTFLAARSGAGAAVTGYLRASTPRSWLFETVAERVRALPKRFRGVLGEGVRALGNPSLETGGPAGPGQGHPVADRVAAKLASRQRAKGTRETPAFGTGRADAVV